MQKHVPLLAVVAITVALIMVAVTRGFGAFEARTTGADGTGCYAQGIATRECIEELRKRCKKYPVGSTGYRSCMKEIGRPPPTATNRPPSGRPRQNAD